MKNNSININIWDDYHDDGYTPVGETQETYAYIESDLNGDDCKAVLTLFKTTIESLSQQEWNLELYLEYYDSAKIYPNLIGTEHEHCLYKRWQLEIKNLTHRNRELLIELIKNQPFMYHETPIVVYSES